MNRKAPTWQIDVARHLLGDLDGHRDAEVRAYIESGDAETARLSAEARTALARLMNALEPIAPPETARHRLLDRVRASHPLEGVADRGAYDPPLISALDSPTPLPGRLTMRVPASIAAVLALLVVFGAALLVNRNAAPVDVAARPNDSMPPGTRAPATNAPASAPDLFSLADMMQSLFDVIPLQPLELEPTLPEQPAVAHDDAPGRLLWDRKHSVCYVFTPMLEPAGENGAYQLWFAGEQSKPMSVGVFDIDASGWGCLRVDLPASDLAIARASISRRTSGDETAEGVDELLFGRFSR